ncbi:MAG: class I adenylate-forming enzyme family protein [Lentisphaeria bacterium]|jgi:acyl-CoA synthetase (AMP-forming)/AMP-acid ligase II|nr:class I adenylate-forming enzyme family protein [Lentisphaeria bacterium]
MSTIIDLWQDTERRHGHRVALADGGRRTTYSELGRDIRRLAGMLQTRWETAAGDVVGLLAPNTLEFVLGYFAVVHCGAVVQPLDERLTPEEIAGVLNDSEAQRILVHRTLWPKLAAVRERLPRLQRVLGFGIEDPGVESFAEWACQPEEGFRGASVTPDLVAELMYTSGTTGAAKGVMRTHANVRAISQLALRGFGYRSDDVIAIVMPMSHSSALASQMMPFVEIGGTIVPLERFDAALLLERIREERVTCLRAVPTVFRTLLLHPGFGRGELPSLRLVMNSSAAIDPETFTALKKRFPAIEMVNSYGLTEASTCTILGDREALQRPDSIGVPIEGVEMAVMDEDGDPAPPGAEGEIWVRGAHVFAGYRNRPAATGAALAPGGWLRTGDIGHRDADGFYYFHGRKDDVINCAGRKYAPLEVENCILELPGVVEAAVVGVPHKALGQVAKAYVVLNPGSAADTREIKRHCARRLASHKVPFAVEAVARLPKNSVGKILYRDLKNRASS